MLQSNSFSRSVRLYNPKNKDLLYFVKLVSGLPLKFESKFEKALVQFLNDSALTQIQVQWPFKFMAAWTLTF